MTPEHHVISTVYLVKSRIESYLDESNECRGVSENGNGNGKSKEADQLLRWTHKEMGRVLEMTKRIQETLKTLNGQKRISSAAPVRDVVHESVGFLQKDPSIKDAVNGIEVLRHVPDDFPMLVCDKEELKEIIYHILRNAFQALAEKKEGMRKIIIRAFVAMNDNPRKQPAGEIEIIDTANGIRRDALPYIFEPFYSTKPWGEGNGLGLWLARQLVQKNEGQISVKTFEGCGTAFSLSFAVHNNATLQ